MKKFLVGFMMFGCLAMVLMIPAFAETTVSKSKTDGVTPLSTPGINKTYSPGTGNGMTNRMMPNGTPSNGYYYNNLNGTRTGTGNGMGSYGTYGTGNYGTYGTGNYGMYGTDGNYGAYDSTRMNTYRPYGNTYRPYNTNLTTRTNHTVRAMETTAKRSFNWGWLGLLGLFGLAGMRSRSSDEAR
ncbi:WGxxGxxG family protein [Cohnella herbarum]|uniref:WGxxGxxG-CTERM domain-containing protein n=1 Tax=Cohnella herbarum TaxID=2728023 RepID=A0A7Z2VF61_9BACL|nr:WGxxGxxG family protein [Cohnella herbarum]QJD82038.1 WGxxGxxG-CTERM domain-containing protein [Cohnella herbarum]